jgi:carbamate kinase
LEEEYLKKLVVALGGNAILKYGEKGTFQDQISNLKRTATQLAPVIASWYQVVITHGNGPQVGNILIQNERAKQEVPAMPLDVCGAQSQGQIGYFLQQVLNNELRQMGKSTEVAMILTQTVVDRVRITPIFSVHPQIPPVANFFTS